MAKDRELKAWLEKEFPGSAVEYMFAGEMHKFRINFAKTAYWLYISREFVDDHDVGHIINPATKAKITEIFRQSNKPKWIFLGEGIAKEVDENFTKPK